MPSKILFFIINVLIITIGARAQENNISIGTWRVHLPYQSLSSVEVASNRIYTCADVNGFYYDKSDNSIIILSKINGLSDIGINKIRYHQGLNLLVLGYTNGNIDIIKDNAVINISDIKRKNIVGSKKINDISFRENFAYLSCDFGVVVLNLTPGKLEIKETYSSLAAGGLSNKVYSSAFSSTNDSLFLATERGLMVGKISPSINLMDYNNWFTYGPAQGITSSEVAGVVNFNGKIYAAVNNVDLYYKSENNWTVSSIPLENNFRSFRTSGGKLLICAGTKVKIASNETTYTDIVHPLCENASEATYDNQGKLWISDLVRGLISDISGTLQPYIPNAPNSNDAFRLSYHENTITVVSGGYNTANTFLGRWAEYYRFNNFDWYTVNTFTQGFPFCTDLVNSTYNPKDGNVYIASYGYGIVVSKPDGTFELIDDTVAPFVRAIPNTPGPYVLITDVKTDKDGNLWATNYSTPSITSSSLHYRKNGVWASKSFGTEAARFPVELLIDDNNYKWISLKPENGGGLLVYNELTNTHRYLTDVADQGGMPHKSVRTMAKDLTGNIWVGTDEGIAIFYNTKNILNSSTDVNSVTPIYDGFPLLYNEAITCIEVDGGNRKWIGTRNGLWLLNDDGTETLNYFTEGNSPLLSNFIVDVEVNEQTGEVFIATDKGLVSYRGDATTGTLEHKETVKVFPNPVTPGFNGMLGISGLTRDAVIKITDVFGNLIYQTNAEGGTAVWNVKDYNGRRAEPGVYLIFSSSEDGVETHVGKFAVTE